MYPSVGISHWKSGTPSEYESLSGCARWNDGSDEEEQNATNTINIFGGTVNINSSGLNRESRAKVLEAVKEILNNSLNDDVIDIEVDKKDNA